MNHAFAILLLSGALSVSPAGLRAQGPNLRVQIPAVEGMVLLDSLAVRFPFSGPRDRLLAAFETTFAEYDLPVEHFDASMGQAPNRRVTRTRRLGNQAMSRYLDCGRSFSGNNADVYRITLAAAAWLQPAAGEVTSLHVAIIGGGQDQAGARNDYVLCTSRGVFEEEFVKRVAARVK